MAPEYDVEANAYGEHEQTRMGGMMMRDIQRCAEEVKTLLAKNEKMMDMGFAIPGAVLSGCILTLRELLRELDGEVNARIVIAVLLLILAILLNVATWLRCHEWGSELVAVSTEIEETLAMHQAASTEGEFRKHEGEFQERVWAFSIWYMTVVSLQTTYLLCSLLGLLFAMVEWSPPYLSWIWFGLGLLFSVVVIIHGIFRVYQAYRSYCSLSKSLTRTRPRLLPFQPFQVANSTIIIVDSLSI